MDATVAVVLAVGSLVVAIISVSITYMTFKKSGAKDMKDEQKEAECEAKEEGEEKSTLHADIKYLIRRAEDTALDIKEMRREYGGLSERITRVEESSKSAHNRLDDLMSGKIKIGG